MISYTPGPWGIVKDKCNINYGDIESCYNGALVCIMPEIDSGLEDELISEADARLIAAAPEMKEWITEMREAIIGGDADAIIVLLTTGRSLLRQIEGEENHND